MKQFKGTKGEWRAHTYGVWARKPNTITDIVNNPQDNIISDEEKKANCKLIAAAPDLLEVCLMFEKFDHVETYSKKWRKLAEKHLDMCEKAIKKALGDEQI